MNSEVLGHQSATVPASTPRPYYHPGSALLHWLTVALLLIIVPLGAILEDLPRVRASFQYYNLHKWLGVIVFFLTCTRLLWRLRHPAPAWPTSLPAWQQRLASLVHALMYGLLLSIPLVGWIGSSAGGFPVILFNVLPLPAPVPKSRELDDLLSGVHSVLAWSLVTLVALHVLAVIKHQFVDCEALLLRMVAGLKRR